MTPRRLLRYRGRMHTRAIRSSGEALPVIGCGTSMGFDRAPGSAEFAQLDVFAA